MPWACFCGSIFIYKFTGLLEITAFQRDTAGYSWVQFREVTRVNFSEFANTLYPIIGNGNTTGEFARLLFKQIIEFPEEMKEDNPLEDQLGSSFKHYFNGARQIKELAKQINPYIEITKFESFIDSFGDGTAENLANAFSSQCPGISDYNVAQKLSELFQNILLEAVKTKRKTASGKTGNGVKDKYGTGLVIETNCTCPNDWCSNSLQADNNGVSELCYELFRIDDSLPEEPDNLIALCPTCFSKLKTNCPSGTRERLRKLKDMLVQNATNTSALSSEKLERDVEAVLEKISCANPAELIPLNYDPVPVKQKIKNDIPLFIRVNSYVTAYYTKVDQWLKQMDQEGKQRFKPFCNTMKVNFIKLDDGMNSQQQIFDALVDWLDSNTHQNRAACEIVVAYFVQKCEVFNADTE